MRTSPIAMHIMVIALLCSALNSTAQTFERKGNVVTYRGNKFLYSPQNKKEKIEVIDPITNKKTVRVEAIESRPIKMNGERIYYAEDMSMAPLPDGKEGDAELTILKALQPYFNKLPDGKYYLDLYNVILDKKGKVVFYEYNGLLSHAGKVKIPADIAMAIDSKIDSLVINISPHKPGRADNSRNVIANAGIYMSFYAINVKKHKTTFGKK